MGACNGVVVEDLVFVHEPVGALAAAAVAEHEHLFRPNRPLAAGRASPSRTPSTRRCRRGWHGVMSTLSLTL
jgi:hypothetical protein